MYFYVSEIKAQISKTMGKHNETGKKGEDLANDFLIGEGFEILARNWRYGKAELDIIGMDGRTMVFVEVKTRSDDLFERPEDAVTTRKQKLLTQAAIGYMHKSGHDWAVRFDILGIILRGSHPPQITHLKDAFFLGLGE